VAAQYSEHLRFRSSSLLRYPGSKTRIAPLLRHYRPLGCRTYREPFCGGAGLFFEVGSTFETVWLNDLHRGLIEFYTALRDRPRDFIAACRAIDPARPDDLLTGFGPRGGARKNARLMAKFDAMKLDPECDQALRYFFINRCVFGSGRVNYDLPSRLSFGSSTNWASVVTTTRLEEAAAAFPGVRLTCGDYHALFEEPGDDVWIFADPPYVRNTELPRTSQQYQHGFGEQDHHEFAEAIKKCRHNVAITYDDCPLVRSLFPASDFWIEPLAWKYVGTTSSEKRTGSELLIMNYEPPVWDASRS
jgi:DNA adenine methylase